MVFLLFPIAGASRSVAQEAERFVQLDLCRGSLSF